MAADYRQLTKDKWPRTKDKKSKISRKTGGEIFETPLQLRLFFEDFEDFKFSHIAFLGQKPTQSPAAIEFANAPSAVFVIYYLPLASRKAPQLCHKQVAAV